MLNINSLNVSWDLRRGIVFAGRVSIAKGALVLEYLISKLDCPIHIIGNGPELSKLRHYCKENKINNVESILDLGSGLNFNKKGLKKLINMILNQ